MASAMLSAHADYVTDIAYDYYGKRMCTASADRRLKVWGQSQDGTWHCQAEFEAHTEPVMRVDWAHPEYGQVLASCGMDAQVCVWEESEAVDDRGRIVSKWNRRGTLVDARDTVNDVKFAPKSLGLVLVCNGTATVLAITRTHTHGDMQAAGSRDGTVRIYEATDTMNLAHWDSRASLDADATPGGVTCLSWNMSPFNDAMLVVGSASSVVRVWGYSKSLKRWTAMLEMHGHAGPVRDVAWAPNIGRSYHLIAAASKDGVVTIWRAELDGATPAGWPKPFALPPSSGTAGGSWTVRKLADSTVDGQHVAAFDDHHAPVWRVKWNVTGTVLASTGEDGALRLWRHGMSGQWESSGVIDHSSALSAAMPERFSPRGDVEMPNPTAF